MITKQYFLLYYFFIYWLLWNYDAKFGFNPTDEARVLGYIQRISNGSIPHEDFIFPHLAGSAYLYYFLNFIDSNVIFLQRIIGVINLLIYSYLFLILTGKIFTNQNAIIKFLLLVLSFNINMHYFGLHIWPTSDAILLSVISSYIIYRKERYQFLGFIILGAVPPCKIRICFFNTCIIFLLYYKKRFEVK